ncbi:hypothetical protein C0992_006653 [Termitomyces sp. T32_za158]|nr:hypothetical protein C0992_006653 [Termitomyces sp. T32_za158]
MIDWPLPPGILNEAEIKEMPQSDVKQGQLGKKAREKEQLERKSRLEGAIGVGPARQSNFSTTVKAGPGRSRIELLDDLVITCQEPKSSSNPDLQVVSYCVACDKRTVGRDFKRALDHAGTKCETLRKQWPQLYQRTKNSLVQRSVSNALEKGNTKNLSNVRKLDTEIPLQRQGSLLEHFNTAKISQQQQAYLDLILFKFFICCAIPFSVLDDRFFRDLLTGLAMNYVVPERTTFFTRHIAQESAVLRIKLKEYLSNQIHLTLSFDGWSTRAKDEIYTFHATTQTRRSFFVEGHVFKGVSVTGRALQDVGNSILMAFDPKKFSAVAGDGGANVRVGKREINELYPWILTIYDPCHNLNLFLKDVGKNFKDLLTKVSSVSNYFGKSNYGTFQLSLERSNLGISEGMKTASETRFSSSYLQAKAIQSCMPAITACIEKQTLTFDTAATKKLIPILNHKTQSHHVFMGELSAFIQLLAPGAKQSMRFTLAPSGSPDDWNLDEYL